MLFTPGSAEQLAAAFEMLVRSPELCRELGQEGRSRVILFNLSGHGHLDLKAYEDFLTGRLEDYAYPQQQVERAVRELAGIQP